jgi:hypothetical protein
VQITRFGGPEVLDVVDLPDPVPGAGEQLYEVGAAGISYAVPIAPCPEATFTGTPSTRSRVEGG